jgi:hypothetical protein
MSQPVGMIGMQMARDHRHRQLGQPGEYWMDVASRCAGVDQEGAALAAANFQNFIRPTPYLTGRMFNGTFLLDRVPAFHA